MRAFAVPGALILALLAAPAASAETATPPFVDHTEWVQWANGTSLRVFPTPSARAAARQPGTADADEAWHEVLAKAPGADTPGMRAQFICHWELAEFAEPGKTSWNLEPWRPVVDDATMLASGCNPGGAEM
ncbi:DUF2599 domain-containing protein [Mycobacterium branderi]|uniref:DUF2599 domain-containing protein n=1 Tax=Mycobacterium branderi TaxID=43348 RepID=A0A7I7W0L3_9MYCO|nr:DUF2599 domain-containing protein [Mycobacterium branderi]MCV7233611.1 DUF2599 domain-containing protein [Mycobacterium branderi]ORA41639.1 hypothetical protein BST20_06060 [Mycobacterium branderi]BBZ10730.1 hypothetical protein MBRA_09250 [Mycobacterium branderi]